MKFSEYYQFYLAKHQDVRNRRFHLAGQVATWVYFLTMLALAVSGSASWLWLLLTPFVVYPFAVPGHYLYEGNKPAFFSSSPLYAKLADMKMCWEMLTGKLPM